MDINNCLKIPFPLGTGFFCIFLVFCSTFFVCNPVDFNEYENSNSLELVKPQ